MKLYNMRLLSTILFVFIFSFTANSQNFEVDIVRTGGGCDGPDTLSAVIQTTARSIVGNYNYETYNYVCGNNDTLSGSVMLEQIMGVGDNTYRFSDFSFGVWLECIGIDPPTGSLNFTYQNNLIGDLTGTDNYGDAWSFDSFIRENNSYLIQWSNTYGDFGMTRLMPDDGRELAPVEGETSSYQFLWSTGDTSDMIEALTEGVYTVFVTDNNENVSSSSIELEFSDAFPDAQTLIELYNSLGGENWIENDGWRQAASGDQICDPCEWSRVICFGGNRVNFLDLAENNLTGNIPGSIANLSELRILTLNDNNISGQIPAELFFIPRLSRVSLDRNLLEGNIPAPPQGNRINSISIAENRLTGSIPPEIGNMTMLESFDFSSNELTGEIPEEILSLTNLTDIVLFNNNLSGTIPDGIGLLPLLNGLYLSYNNLTGPIPSSLGSNVSITELYLSDNQIEGNLPDNLFEMEQLRKLYLNNNQLSGCYPEAKDSICNLPQSTTTFTITLNGEEFEVYFEDGCNLMGNPLLPWLGDLENHCNDQDQIGAPCDTGNKNAEPGVINADCECEPTSASYDLSGIEIEIYPNPVIDNLLVNVQESNGIQASLIDVNGKKVKDLQLNQQNNIEALPAGVYIVKVSNQQNVFITETLIKL